MIGRESVRCAIVNRLAINACVITLGMSTACLGQSGLLASRRNGEDEVAGIGRWL